MAQDEILANWSPSDKDLFGKHNLRLQHRLVESGLFSEERLARVIEKIPSSNYNLNTMGYDYDNPDWREGRLNGQSGSDVIESIKRGRMWLNMRRLQDVDQEYGDVLDKIFDEFEQKVPGLKTFKTSLGVLISSPKVRIFYHADVPGQALWQIQGRKRLYVYPNSTPFLKPEDMEKVVIGMQEEEIPYEAWFDDHSKVYDLGPGEMVHWPLNGPHQVMNEDCLNISVTTSHYTKDIRNAYVVNYANGVLRQKFGYAPRAVKPTALTTYPKAAMALVWKQLGLQKSTKFKPKPAFTVDPKSETGMVDLVADAAE